MMWDLLKDLWLLFGRMFPMPTKPGLRMVGKPGRSSPVLVTCNFDLTVRKVIRALERDEVDAWLLVAPTRGINVWCAAGAGYFTTDTVISILKTSDIAERVDHRRLILPQLAAAGVNIWALKKRTGWKPRFGPVDIRSLGSYLESGSKLTEPSQHRVAFGVRDRFVMGTNLGFNSLLFLIVPMLVASIWLRGFWWRSILLVFALAVLNSVLVFRLPGKPGIQKGLALGLGAAAVVGLLSQTLWSMAVGPFLGWAAWIVVLATYLGYDIPSWSPLWRADVKELVLGKRHTHIEIVEDRCVGCHLCDVVCPVSVFERNPETRKYFVASVDACQACGACVESCPTEAIVTNFRAATCACPTCTVINGVSTLKSKASTLQVTMAPVAIGRRCDSGETVKSSQPGSEPASSKCGPGMSSGDTQ
ncbi:MAG: HgcAB-like fusion protein [Thermoanaerobaculales bacterium]